MRAYVKGDDGTRRRLRAQPARLGRHLRPPRPPALGQRQLHHRARRLHAGRPLRLQREAQRGERRGQPRRPRRQPLVELRRRGPDRRPRGAGAARPDAALRHDGADRQPGRADAPDGRRERPHPAGQQQRLLPGQRAGLDGLEPRPARARLPRLRRRARCGSAASCRCSRRSTGCAASRCATAACRACAGCAPTGCRWARRNGRRRSSRRRRSRSPTRTATGRCSSPTPPTRTCPSCCPRPARDRPWRLRLDSGSGAIDAETKPRPAGSAAVVAARSLQLYSVWPDIGDAARLRPRQSIRRGGSDE